MTLNDRITEAKQSNEEEIFANVIGTDLQELIFIKIDDRARDATVMSLLEPLVCIL